MIKCCVNCVMDETDPNIFLMRVDIVIIVKIIIKT